MIERGSGRTSGLTDWRLMDVLSMWACLQDQDTTGHWKQVAGWRKVCDLAVAHLSRLQEYRRGLAEAWPPETNAAARAYIGELDQLIEKVQRTHDAAAANYDALAAATRALSSTRADLKPIYEEYATRLQQKRAYEAVVADPKAVAGSRLPEQPPVTDADLEQLNVQARSLMTGLSGELQQAQVMLRQPPPPPRRPGIQPNDADAYGSNTTAPVIPPIAPLPIARSSSTPLSRSSTPDRGMPVSAAFRGGPVLGAGPVLGGAGAGLAPAPAPPGSPGVIPSAQPAPSTSSGLGLQPIVPPSTGTPARGSASGRLRAQPGPVGKPLVGGVDGSPHATPPRRAAPGGLIGGTPGVGVGQPGARAVPPRRVNPVGGVIGGGGAGTAPSGGAGFRPGAGRAALGATHGMPPIGGAPGMGASPGRLLRTDQVGGESRQWDPDHPWEIDHGVAPVVRPPDEQGPIDPGPAIGLGR